MINLKKPIFILSLILLFIQSTPQMLSNCELIKAAKSNDINRVSQLIKEGVSVNIQNKWGSSALHKAVSLGYLT